MLTRQVFPYTMALYAGNLAKVASGGLNERQLRVSVGLEDTDLILAAFKQALTFADATRSGNGFMDGSPGMPSTVC